MRVVIIANPYYPIPPKKYGGTERVIQYLIKGLMEAGHEPILLGTGDSVVDCQLIPVIERAIPFPKRDSEKFRWKIKDFLQKTRAELNRIAPSVDIIHSHDFDLKDFQHFPNVTTVHGHFSFANLNYYQKRKGMPIIAISKNQQVSFPDLNYAGVVYNGLDPKEFPVILKPENYLSFVGRFDWDKSPHLAIQLALALRIKIKLAGKIDLLGTEYFREQIKPYLKNPLVEYLGEIDTKAKIELVSKARCNIHPLLARREPFGLTVIEALYCGTPTIAMNRSSMPEIIKNGKTGLLVEDFVEAYQKIEECLALDRQYIAEHTRAKFNYKNMTRNYLRTYKKVLKIYKVKKENSRKFNV